MTTEAPTLKIIEGDSTFSVDKAKGKITIESSLKPFPSAIGELESVEPRHMAIGFAASQGMPDPRINGNVVGPYAVNSAGVELTQVKGPNSTELPADHPDKQPAAYRVDVPVCRKLV